MHVIIICKFHEDPTKNEEATLFTRSIIAILTIKGTLLCYCWSDLTQFRTRQRFHACHWYLQVSWRSSSKRRSFVVHKVSNGHFWQSRGRNSAIAGPIWPIFELVRDFMHVIIICKFHEDPTKMKKLRCSQAFSNSKPHGTYQLP